MASGSCAIFSRVENNQIAPILLFAVHAHEKKSLAFG